MKIAEILAMTDTKKMIEELKKRPSTPDIATYVKEYDHLQHEVMNTESRPDKQILEGTTIEEGGDGIKTRIEKVARIALAIQKLIVKRSAAFVFGNPVKFQAQPEGKVQDELFGGVKKILSAVKINSFNRRLARELFKATEVAECWYPVESRNTQYGFDSKFKLRVALFSPMNGDELYPLYDELGDLVAFSRAYSKAEGTETLKYFETWTADRYMQWQELKTGWEQLKDVTNVVGKIPVIYASQEATEWADAQVLIDRLEKLLSNFADTNDYHASPKIFVTGTVNGFSKKGESGAIIEGENGSDAKYLAWQFAPESVKLEIATLLNLIYTLTQTPDISFESVRGIGAISGVALELLFMDAHLKVQDKMEVFDAYLQRRVNLLKAFCGKMNTKFEKEIDNLIIEPIVTPYIIGDKKTMVDTLSIANGGKPVISQRTGVMLAGLVDDVDAELKAIQDEAAAESTMGIFEPTM